MSDLKFTKEHEWAELKGTVARMGISDYAQKELGDAVLIDLPVVGKTYKKGETVGAVESVKAVSDIYAPISGEVVAVNEDLGKNPELINQSPEDKAWIAEIKFSDVKELDALMDSGAYLEYIKEISK